jgi:hypothetical protein
MTKKKTILEYGKKKRGNLAKLINYICSYDNCDSYCYF